MLKEIKTKLGVRNVTLELAVLYVYKQIYQQTTRHPVEKVILPIFGCQRSGTSLMTRVFFRDVHAKVYRESSILSQQDPERLRLDPWDSLSKRFADDRALLIVLKPLVESQNARAFLSHFSRSRGLWLYRDYRDIAASNLAAFGTNNGIDDLRPVYLQEPGNWRSEHVSEETRAIVCRFFAEDMTPYDAAALFWFVRNQLFFDQMLDSDSRVMLYKYEDFVGQPLCAMQAVYRFLELPFPSNDILKEIHAGSVSKGKAVEISPAIDLLCREMLERLDSTYNHQKRADIAVRTRWEQSA